jgi:hypothetical protein
MRRPRPDVGFCAKEEKFWEVISLKWTGVNKEAHRKLK